MMNEFIEKLVCSLENQKNKYKKLCTELEATDSNYFVGKMEGFAVSLNIVHQLLDEYKNTSTEHINCSTGWIHCSERLPEKSGKYLVTINCGGSVHTTVRRFNPKPKHPEQNEPIFTKRLPLYSGWERRTCGVIAWQPLPEPFKQKGEQTR